MQTALSLTALKDGVSRAKHDEEWSRKNIRCRKKNRCEWYRFSADKIAPIINNISLTHEVMNTAINTWLAQEDITAPLFAVKKNSISRSNILISKNNTFLDNEFTGALFYLVIRERDRDESTDIDIVSVKTNLEAADELATELCESEMNTEVIYYVKKMTDGVQNVGDSHSNPYFVLQHIRENAEFELARVAYLHAMLLKEKKLPASSLGSIVNHVTNMFFSSAKGHYISLNYNQVLEIVKGFAIKGIRFENYYDEKVDPFVQKVLDANGITVISSDK